MELLISVQNGQIKYLKKSNCCIYSLKSGACIAKNTIDIYENKDQEDPVKFIKEHQGILIWENKEKIEIYCDPFCSIPFYYFYKDDALILTASFNEIEQEKSGFSIDPAGFYELLLYGICLNSRTLFNEVKQLPAASVLTIEKKTNNSELSFYWNFQIKEDQKIKSENMAVDLIFKRLKTIFTLYHSAVLENKKKENIWMGLSGGLDSRMSLCLMSEIWKKGKVQTFTFGYHKRILEYKFAKKTAKKLKQSKPEFYKLTPKAYQDSFELAKKTGGEIGIHHCHIYSYLKTNKKCDCFLSNYYSDAVMGWDAKANKEEKNLEHLSYFRKLSSNHFQIENETKDLIKEDIKIVSERYEIHSNFSGLEEFFYVVEKNPKFHVKLSYQYNNVTDTILPYADYKLLCDMISIPLKFRYEKKLEEKIISQFLQINDISSRRYFERSPGTESSYSWYQKIYYGMRNWQYHKLDAVNRRLNKISRGKLALMDPFKTEEQLTVIMEMSLFVKRAIEFFISQKILSSKTGEELLDEKNQNFYIGEKFTLLSMWIAIQKTV